MVGDIPLTVLHVPGHTPADMAYIVGDAAFIGDTMFMPDYCSARADFPVGYARNLYQSLLRLLRLPDHTRLFLFPDYNVPHRLLFFCYSTLLFVRSSHVFLLF